MRINKITLLTLILLLTIVFSISNAAEIRVVTMGTDPVDSGTYAATAGLCNIINMYNKGNIIIKVKPTTGPKESSGLLATGEIELVAQSQDYTQPSWLSKGEFQIYDKIAKVNPTRTLFGSMVDLNSAYTINGTGILKGTDLKGKRWIGQFTGAPRSTDQASGFLANWGLTDKDVQMVAVPGFTSSTEVILEGGADAVGEGGPAGGDMAELNAVKGIRFLSLNADPEAIKAYEKAYGRPISWTWVDPNPNIIGVQERIAMLTFRDYYLCNPNKISDDEAYAIVEALWDHMDLVNLINVDFFMFKEPKQLLIEMPMVPYHNGSIKFFKEKGLWTPELQARQDELLALEAEEMK